MDFPEEVFVYRVWADEDPTNSLTPTLFGNRVRMPRRLLVLEIVARNRAVT